MSVSNVISKVKGLGSKVYMKAFIPVASAVTAISTMAISASAEEVTTTVDTAPLIAGVQQYVPAALAIMLGVGGIKIGLGFLRKQIKG